MKRGRGGVRYEELEPGLGEVARKGATVTVKYSIALNRGEVVEDERVASFKLGERRVIAGLEYGVEGMRVGGRRRLRVGPRLAYREGGVPGKIPSNAVLDIDLVLLNVST